MATKVEQSEKNYFPIVAKIMAFLHLDEAGKIDKFFQRELRKAENAIRDTKNNMLAKANQHKSDLQKIDDELEDALDSVEFAKQNVVEDDVKNNEACESFAPTYWARIKCAQNKVKDLEETRKQIIKRFEESVEADNAQIEAYQERIDQIKG